MVVNIVSSIANGAGLQRDFETLSAWLYQHGYEVRGLGIAGNSAPDADLTIFDEAINPLKLGKRNWVMPHPEWWFPEWDRNLAQFEKVLAKTRDCQRVFGGAEYIGWGACDLLGVSVPREHRFLHVAGQSELKNTQAVMEAWRRYELPPLTIVSEVYRDDIRNVAFRQRVTREELVWLMNSHLFHLVPSAYEGFGHVLHEALGVGATLITTDAPPMNEIQSAVRVPTCGSRRIRRATVYDVSPDAIAKAVLSVKPIYTSRDEFEQERMNFEQRLSELFA